MNRFSPKRLTACLAVWISFFLTARGTFAQQATAQKSGSREAMLQSLVQKVIAPGYASLSAKCGALADDIAKFDSSPQQAELDRARQSWVAALEAAESLRCFQTGPVADREFISTFYYWQAVTLRIEAIVKDSSQNIDQVLIDNAGATVKGLYTIEYLLFDRRGGQLAEPPDSAKALDLLSSSQRRREYLAAVARDTAKNAAQLSTDWAATGPQSATGKFSASAQESVNLLVNQLTQSLEITLQNHLNFVLLLPAPIDRQFSRIKGSRSGTSLQSVIVALEGVEKFYLGENGLGLHDSLNRLNPALAKRVQGKLRAAISATRDIGQPLEKAVVGNRVAIQSAVDEIHSLEILFKVDLASALGVTITFTSGDGD